MIRIKIFFVVFLALALTLGMPAASWANFITNGSFDQSSNGAGQVGYNTTITGWSMASSGGYTFLFTSGSADTTGVTGQFGNLKLWGPNDGSANGLTAASPDGGNFIASDGDFQQVAIQQTLSGLTQGQNYQVGFWWAGAQQSSYTGVSTDQWQVSFGGQTQSTSIYTNPSEGFSGWMYQTFTFQADGASDVLSFLAVGTPAGVPPFSLLDGVSVQSAVPEPSTLCLMGLGLIGIGVIKLRTRLRMARS